MTTTSGAKQYKTELRIDWLLKTSTGATQQQEAIEEFKEHSEMLQEIDEILKKLILNTSETDYILAKDESAILLDYSELLRHTLSNLIKEIKNNTGKRFR